MAEVRQGLATGDDDRFLRMWYEVSIGRICLDRSKVSESKWFLFNKGGPFRRWYGNNEYVVDWQNDGKAIRNNYDLNGRLKSRPQNQNFYFCSGITWSLISIAIPSFRVFDDRFIFGHKGPGIFANASLSKILAFLNSHIATRFLRILSPGVGFEIGQIRQLPFALLSPDCEKTANDLIQLHKADWDQREESWDFTQSPVLSTIHGNGDSLESSLSQWVSQCKQRIERRNHLKRITTGSSSTPMACKTNSPPKSPTTRSPFTVLTVKKTSNASSPTPLAA